MNHFRSQCGEDKWLAACWQGLGLPYRGYFVDVGAADGETFSNTYWLEHALGWRGLLIEPDPRHEIRNRPKSRVERVAVGPSGVVSLARCVDPFLNSTLREDATQPEHERLAIEDRIEVTSVPLTTLLEANGVEKVDIISVDTEGTEIEAWRTLDLSRWRPTVAIVEYSTWQLNDDLPSLEKAMGEDGYRLAHKTTYNGIFVGGK